MNQGTSWSLRDHLNQAAEFGYVRTPGHSAGCQCDSCEATGRRWAEEKMIGLYHSDTLGVTIVIVRDGNMDEHAAYRALLPYGMKSERMSDQSMASALRMAGYRKIGGR